MSFFNSVKRKRDECENINKKARMDDVIEIGDEFLCEAEKVEITEPGPSTMPLRTSPSVMISENRCRTKRFLLLNSAVDPTTNSDNKNEIKRTQSLKSLSIKPFMSNKTFNMVKSANIKSILENKSSTSSAEEKPEIMKHEVEKIEPPKQKDVFPGYSKEIQDYIVQFMSGPQNEKILSDKNIRISDLKTVHIPTTWLNDEVINQYSSMIVNRDPLSIHAFDTFFYLKLSSQGYQSVRRWTRKKDIFACNKMFIPIHLGNHLCLTCVDFINNKTIEYYDSFGGKNPKCLDTIFNYLTEEYKDKKKEEFDCTGWQLINAIDCPKQLNGFDCGVFTCANAEYLARDAILDFTQHDMPKLRLRLCHEIINNTLCY